MLKFLKNRDFLVKLLLSYFLVFVIPFVAGLYAYYNGYSISLNNLKSYSKTIMTNLPSKINDVALRPLELIEESINASPFYLTLISNHNLLASKNEIILDIRNFTQQLMLYYTSPFILEIGIYIPFENIIITPNFFESSKLYYDYIVRPIDTDYLDWLNLLNKSYNRYFMPMSFLIRGQPRSTILFLHSLPYWTFQDKKATLFILLDEEKLNDFIKSNVIYENSNIYVLNSDNTTLTQYVPDKNIDSLLKDTIKNSFTENSLTEMKTKKDKIILYYKSDMYQWKYIIAISSQSFFKPINNMKIYLLLYFIFSLILGLPTIVLLSLKSYRPVDEIKNILVSKFKKQKFSYPYSEGIENIEDKSEMIKLKELASLLVAEEEFLRKQINEFLPTLQNWFLEHLLVGNIPSAISEKEVFEKYQIKFDSDLFMVILVEIYDCQNFELQKDITDYSFVRFIIFNILNEVLTSQNNKVYNVILGEKKLGIILNIVDHNDTVDSIVGRLEYGKNFIQSNFAILLTIGVSTIKKGISAINTCFEEAEKALSLKFISGNVKIYKFSDALSQLKDETLSFITPEMENRILECILNGNKASLEEIFKNIHSKIFVSDNIPIIQAKLLCVNLYILYENACRLINYKSSSELFKIIENEIITKTNTLTLDDLFFKIQDNFIRLAEFVKNNQLSFRFTLVEKVKTYIDEMYSDPNLSLSLIAEKFNITPQYLSSLFKEKTGQNLSDYITHLRIEKAKLLLTQTNYSVNEIALKVGYIYPNSFINVFKKKVGLSPTKYRTLYSSQN
ncbi:transcriptional regulator, AraC family [Caldicellulosiruptor hydrothermalis 108]|uniref:Transcriptional regulator, AraC family n=1 Tax=Caldicellulosiruptor hydrothermalis (strain DSM 18901 / VKM B-2411 / 108) TaxID=632292 RepID=E4Q9Y2_CALH1|nr:AraC family transcriptional regulator [Caldicellulosiruptor hydrothermalis]ADQ05857.1 transcriptional regulator, AraC family [Caldicellulosiruptor hydrothermalis 108]